MLEDKKEEKEENKRHRLHISPLNWQSMDVELFIVLLLPGNKKFS
jgi:hypothetical protein